ncbi:hypothetical protein Cni_G21203 [Canna indica]|uniref:tRNA-uridine aminocarboxypropyltransferase n=1 Tax=Canna indica TaxID=4628 RepID=A0AAQ3QKH1_9LILI|nr:hypothetical protein Cni_G21203 [Canna indica]
MPPLGWVAARWGAASIASPALPSKSIWRTSASLQARICPLISSSMSSATAATESSGGREDQMAISLDEWQGWGTSSPVPTTVTEVIENMKVLARDSDAPVTFGGSGGKLRGRFKDQEDKKHRSVYESLGDSEKKLQFFAARQIACRLLGNREHLCQKCWLAMEDCMCSKLVKSPLWSGIKFWLYMHPKDFLRQNNTGKLLWQIFGIQSAALCLFGIPEQEDIMWNAFRDSGKGMVWFLYPNQNESPKSVQDVFWGGPFTSFEGQKEICVKQLNFVLIDGTWSNSAAMFRRVKERWTLTRGEENLPCLCLSTLGASVMHKLRPQPAWDRTCTAAAAAGILSEMHLIPSLSMHGLDKQAEAIEDALDVLLDALVKRRLRMGRSITRRERHNNCI